MGDYEGSTTADLPRDDLFDYLSRIENLPKYMSRMIEAHSLAGDQVSVEAKVEPGDVGADVATADGERTVRGEAWFHIDADARRIEWGSQGPNDYHGDLSVSDDGEGSRVVVRLHTLREDASGIEQGLAETLENIEQLSASDIA